MEIIEGNVLWYERGGNRFDSCDKCYFWAIAIETHDCQKNLFGEIEQYKKVILKGVDAKKCFSLAIERGVTTENDAIYKPKSKHRFKVEVLEPSKITPKEIKYLDYRRWRYCDG